MLPPSTLSDVNQGQQPGSPGTELAPSAGALKRLAVEELFPEV